MNVTIAQYTGVGAVQAAPASTVTVQALQIHLGLRGESADPAVLNSLSTGLSTTNSSVGSLSTSTSTAASSLSTGLGTTNSSVTSLSTSASTATSSLSTSSSTAASSLSTGLSTTDSTVISLSTSTSTAVSSLSTGLSTTDGSVLQLSKVARCAFIRSPGLYIDQAINGEASVTIAGVLNRVVLSPWCPPADFDIDQIGVAVTTGIAGSIGRICIYDSDDDGAPSNLILQTGDLSFVAAAFKSDAINFQAKKTKIYWLGLHSSAPNAVRALYTRSSMQLALSGPSIAAYATAVQRTVAWGNLPAVWGFSAAELVSINPPSIRMRLA